VAESELKLTSLLPKADLELEGLVAKCPRRENCSYYYTDSDYENILKTLAFVRSPSIPIYHN